MEKIRRYVVNPDQRLQVTTAEITDGPGRGMRIVELANSAGLTLQLMPDRALDIRGLMYKGRSAAWLSPSGTIAPQWYNAGGLEWLRTFPGGFLTTCGLSQVGSPCEDGGIPLGLHGRAAHIPVDNLCVSRIEEDDGLKVTVSGTVREGVLFGECLSLLRTITVVENAPYVHIEDRITNERSRPFPLMLLYHFNLGYPLIKPGTRLEMPEGSSCHPRDAVAEKGLDNADVMEEPVAGYEEQVFFHRMPSENDAAVTVSVRNPEGFSAELCYSPVSLPYFSQWKMMGTGDYVLGIEPGNCLVSGRRSEREAGRLLMLEGYGTVAASLHWTFSIE